MPTRTLYFDTDFADKNWAGKHYTLEAPEGDRAHGNAGEWVIGRHPASDLTLALPTVSAKHAAINYSYASARWAITDLGSSNGTFINGERLKSGDPRPLEIGIKVFLASHCIHITEDEQDTVNDIDDDLTTIASLTPLATLPPATTAPPPGRTYADVAALVAEWLFSATTLAGTLYRLLLVAAVVAVVVIFLSGAF